ncbi:hypothetical protein ACRALDRAFT_211425 [Sodiomyces alcalophilus JCM 7366]|uniref:uncharacterized protein n=1 Tax=Sodiomyces alcalophilus JCM 7366 TaxID=591952 RepID=UPI0039B4C273
MAEVNIEDEATSQVVSWPYIRTLSIQPLGQGNTEMGDCNEKVYNSNNVAERASCSLRDASSRYSEVQPNHVEELPRLGRWLKPISAKPPHPPQIYLVIFANKDNNRRETKTEEQPNNQTTKQPNNQTTKQPNNQTTKQPNNQTTRGNKQSKLAPMQETPLSHVRC